MRKWTMLMTAAMMTAARAAVGMYGNSGVSTARARMITAPTDKCKEQWGSTARARMITAPTNKCKGTVG